MRLHDYMEYFAATAPDRLCVSDDLRRYTYGQMDEWSSRIAAALHRLGVVDGDRFAVVAENCADWVAIYYGAFKAGAIPVPLNFRLHPREWTFLLNDSGAKVVLAQRRYAESLDRVRGAVPGVSGWLAIDGSASGWEPLAEVVASADPHTFLRPAIEPDHDLWQMYTSGTTGLPKGAVLTHSAVHANYVQAQAAAPVAPGDTVLVVKPLHHAGAAVGGMVSAISSGATMRIMSDFDPVSVVRSLEEERITRVALVPAMLQRLLVEVPDLQDRTFEHLQLISYGASPISVETLRRALEVFGCDFRQGFGQTEAGATLTVLGPDEHRRALAGEHHLLLSCGRPVVGTDVRVVDVDGEPVATGEIGEIIARGPQIMRGYWHRPDATAETLVDGWLHTGDLGRFDEEGFLYICDRLKDMIVSGGENIYPREVENVLLAMPHVADAAVIGIPDDRWGETVTAVIVLKPGMRLAEDEVIGWCRSHLAGYKSPRAVDFVTELPRNGSGKVLKAELRGRYCRAGNGR